MIDESYDIVVVGGGAAGMAAACAAKQNGADKVLLIERNAFLGGIINQCIHNGFGLHVFKEELCGPEYAQRYIDKTKEVGVEVLCQAMVLDVNADRTVSFISAEYGYRVIKAQAVIVATGSRERARGAVGIKGSRPSGVFTAGEAQLFVNIDGYNVGKKVVILGSGDIGLIMARRMTLEGAKVVGVYELMPYSGGLMRNIVQCLEDYDIPLYLSHTITEIRGDTRVNAVVVQKVDSNRMPIAGTEQVLECDTVLLSVGLLPENELLLSAGVSTDQKTGAIQYYENMQTSVEGIFGCGNVAHIHDLVDFVSGEAAKAGIAAALFAKSTSDNSTDSARVIALKAGDGLGYVMPQKLRVQNVGKIVEIYFRTNAVYHQSKVEVVCGDKVIKSFDREHLAPGEMEKIILLGSLVQSATQELVIRINSDTKQSGSSLEFRKDYPDGSADFVCIVCPKGCRLHVDKDHNVTGNDCVRGEVYGKQELDNPTRIITTTIRVQDNEISRLPIKTSVPIPKDKIFEVMKAIDSIQVKAPINIGDVLMPNVCGTAANIVATRKI